VIVEVLAFRLSSDVSPEAFVAADAAVQTGFYYLRPGIVRRTTARGDDDSWAVVTFWGTMGDAVAADEAGRDDPTVTAFRALITDTRTKRFSTLD